MKINESILNACYCVINESLPDSFKFGKDAEIKFANLLKTHFDKHSALILKLDNAVSFTAKSFEYTSNESNKTDFIFCNSNDIKTGDKLHIQLKVGKPSPMKLTQYLWDQLKIYDKSACNQ